MTTVYEQNKEVWDELALKGFAALAEMAKRFTKQNAMGEAIGMSGSSVSKWVMRHYDPSPAAEKAAAEWLKSMQKPFSIAGELPLEEAKTPTAPAPAPSPAPAANGATLMLVTVAGDASKVQKVLTMLGCEWVEV